MDKATEPGRGCGQTPDLNRRQFGAGIAAAVAATIVPIPSGQSGIPPLPVHAFGVVNAMVRENILHLDRVAREVRRIECLIGFDQQASLDWPNLYDDMVYTACMVRDKGISGRSPDELALLDWVSSIYPDDEARACQPREAIGGGLSPEYAAGLRTLDALLSTQSQSAESMMAAWKIAGLHPRTQDDLKAHRFAVARLYRI